MLTTERTIPSEGVPGRFYLIFVAAAGLVALFFVQLARIWGWQVALDAIRFSPANGDWSSTGFFYVGSGLWLLTAALPLLFVSPKYIRLSPEGVTVVTRLTTRLFYWASLRPSPGLPRGRWGTIHALRDKGGGFGVLWVTREQARAILSDERAPAHLFPPEYWTWIGATLPRWARAA